jgi:hypothetical protein
MTRVVGGLLLALAAATLVLDGLIHRLSLRGAAVGVLIVLTFAGVGLLIVRRQRASPIGWLMILFTALYLLGAATSYYAMLYYRLGHHALPLAPLALLLSSVQVPSFAVFPVVILLFPDGRLTSLRWRRALGAYAVLVGFVLALLVAGAAAAIAGHDVRLSPTGSLTSGSRLAEWFENPPGWLIIPVVAAIVIIGVSFLGHQVVSWRGAEGDRRQQLKWLASGAAVAVASLILAAVLGTAPLLAGLAALPIGIGVGILRYRLYDIDRIISRTLAYALVTGLLVGVYTALVLSIQAFGLRTPVAVAAATLAAAALFNPLRRRVQRGVDRRFNRARYDADHTVAAFAARIKDAVEVASVRDDLAVVVHQALEPTHVSVWISPGR